MWPTLDHSAVSPSKTRNPEKAPPWSWRVAQGDRISYEHPGAPRAPRSAEDKPIGGYREEGFLWSAYRKGNRLGTIASSDHCFRAHLVEICKSRSAAF